MKRNKVISAILTFAMVMSMGTTAVFATELTSDNLADNNLNIVEGTLNGVAYNVFEGDGTTAGKASSVVVIDAEPTTCKVTVPILLHADMDSAGVISTPDSMDSTSKGLAKIVNLCNLGQVKITDVTLTAGNGWSIAAFTDDFSNKKVNTKEYGFKINGVEVNTDGSVITNNAVNDTVSSTYDITNGVADKEEFEDYSFSRTGSSAFPVITNGSVLPIEYAVKLPAMSSALNDVVVGGVVFTVDFN